MNRSESESVHDLRLPSAYVSGFPEHGIFRLPGVCADRFKAEKRTDAKAEITKPHIRAEGSSVFILTSF